MNSLSLDWYTPEVALALWLALGTGILLWPRSKPPTNTAASRQRHAEARLQALATDTLQQLAQAAAAQHPISCRCSRCSRTQ